MVGNYTAVSPLGNTIQGGELEIASEAQGDLLYYNGSAWVRLGAGTSGQVLKTNGAASNPSWVDASAGVWTHIETLTPSAASTITSGTLTAYDQYMVIISDLVASASGSLNLRVNGDSGSNYDQFYMLGTTPTLQTGQTSIQIVGHTTATHSHGIITMDGKSPAVASGKITIAMSTGHAGNNVRGLSGLYVCGNDTQVSTLTFKQNGSETFTGNIEIFGRNVN